MSDSAADRLRGKVAKVLNAREVALNLGHVQGARVGMLFDILDPNGEGICDPDTGEVLGSIERAKVRVRVSQVEERIAVAGTFRTKKVNRGGQGSFSLMGLSDVLRPENWISVRETLRVSDSSWEPLDESDSFVKVGDPVVEVRPVPKEDTA